MRALLLCMHGGGRGRHQSREGIIIQVKKKGYLGSFPCEVDGIQSGVPTDSPLEELA